MSNQLTAIKAWKNLTATTKDCTRQFLQVAKVAETSRTPNFVVLDGQQEGQLIEHLRHHSTSTMGGCV